MDFFVFSHRKPVRAIAIALEGVIVLVSDEDISLFDIGGAKYITSIQFPKSSSNIQPIHLIKSSAESNIFSIQGKMGRMLIFELVEQQKDKSINKNKLQIKFLRQYETGMIGFTKIKTIAINKSFFSTKQWRSSMQMQEQRGKSQQQLKIQETKQKPKSLLSLALQKKQKTQIPIQEVHIQDKSDSSTDIFIAFDERQCLIKITQLSSGVCFRTYEVVESMLDCFLKDTVTCMNIMAQEDSYRSFKLYTGKQSGSICIFQLPIQDFLRVNLLTTFQVKHSMQEAMVLDILVMPSQKTIICTFYRDPYIYFLKEKAPTALEMLQKVQIESSSIKSKLFSIKTVALHHNTLIFSINNLILTMQLPTPPKKLAEKTSNLTPLCQIKQSKKIIHLLTDLTSLVACTEQNQFIYFQL